MKTFIPSLKIYFSFLRHFYLGKTRTKNIQLPASIWNFYYEATKLLQADNCIIITIRWLGEP